MANLAPLFTAFWSTVQAGSSAIGSSSATGINIATGDGAKLPTIGTNQYLPALIVDTSTSPETPKEFVWVTAVATDTLTVVRQAEQSSLYPASTTTVQSGYTIAFAASPGSLVSAGGVYGDASDGDVTITGGTTTLTRDMYYGNLTITGTGVLATAGYRVFAQSVTINSGGSLNNDGLTATSRNGALGAAQGSFGAGAAGGNGGTSTAAGSAGSTGTNSVGGSGGAGGAGGGGAAAGAAGTVTAIGTSYTWRTLMTAHSGCAYRGLSSSQILNLTPGGGGGGGGGGTTGIGGGGGGGGGFVTVAARTISNSGTISAKGGNGFSAPAGGNGAGGGGGGGGCVFIVCRSYTGSGTVSAAGGSAGSGDGTGATGTAGSAGNVVWLQV